MSEHIQKNIKTKQQRQISRRAQLRKQEKTIEFLRLRSEVLETTNSGLLAQNFILKGQILKLKE